MNLTNLQSQIKSLEEKVASLKGQSELIEEQFVASNEKLEELKTLQEINAQSIEILNLIQHETRDKIKEVFENIVSKALNFIYQSNDYQFELDFDRRGNTPKLTMYLKRPDMQEKHNILSCTAGGERDVIALALRFVLLEVSKTPGFLFLDEIEKRLDNEETERKVIEFIKENQMASKRQIMMISHKQSFVDAVPDTIMFTKKQCIPNNIHSDKVNIVENKQVTTNDEEQPKKRGRGRPKKAKNIA